MKVQMSSGVTERVALAPIRPRAPEAPRSASSSSEIASRRAARHPDHVLEPRALVADGADLLQLLVVLDDDGDRVGVLEHVLALLRRVRLVDRDHGRAGGERGEVEVGPLRPGVGEDRDLVALLDPEVDQPERELADDLADLGVGLRDPAARRVLVDGPRAWAVLARPRRETGRRASSPRSPPRSPAATVADSIVRSPSGGRRRRAGAAAGKATLERALRWRSVRAARRRPAASSGAWPSSRRVETKRVLSMRPLKIGTPISMHLGITSRRFMLTSSASSVGVR